MEDQRPPYDPGAALVGEEVVIDAMRLKPRNERAAGGQTVSWIRDQVELAVLSGQALQPLFTSLGREALDAMTPEDFIR